MDSSSLSHTKWKCQYHIVFIPKYRRKVLYGKIKADEECQGDGVIDSERNAK